jgi:hypothetical protein
VVRARVSYPRLVHPFGSSKALDVVEFVSPCRARRSRQLRGAFMDVRTIAEGEGGSLRMKKSVCKNGSNVMMLCSFIHALQCPPMKSRKCIIVRDLIPRLAYSFGCLSESFLTRASGQNWLILLTTGLFALTRHYQNAAKFIFLGIVCVQLWVCNETGNGEVNC